MATNNGKDRACSSQVEIKGASGSDCEMQESGSRRVAPLTDIFEREDSVRLLVDLPGVDETGLSINIEKNVLSIEAKRSLKQAEGMKLAHREWAGYDFARSFTLSDVFEIDAVKAVLKDGVLELDLPKSEKIKPKKIEVRVG